MRKETLSFSVCLTLALAAMSNPARSMSPIEDIPFSKADIPSYYEIAKTELHYPLDQVHSGGEGTFHVLQDTIRGNYDHRCLSNPNCKLVYSCFYSKHGAPVYKILRGENCTDADKFYCEQAIWEHVQRSYLYGMQVVYDFDGSNQPKSGVHQELLSHKGSGCVALHLLPQQFLASHLLYSPEELNNPRNVLRLKEEKLNDPRLLDFRLEWFHIVRYKTTKGEICERAEKIREKYADFFER
ncbi:MAG: hypothetical protein JSS86_12910 [Cyanobacteria bacterium SZAS LIN-2]|nr:hypothetical protein [Cyanobacteria bacterium SZAS LIN-2]MBS2008097.1 hypothetical protein [Cyanobacteria bacterium SZAS TMP-1]